MENVIQDYLTLPNEKSALNLVRFLRCDNKHHLAILIGEFLSKLYNHNIDIRSETAISAYYAGQYRLSYELYSTNISFPNLDEHEFNTLKFNRHFSIDHIKNDYIHYDIDRIDKITKGNVSNTPLVTFTITSCKRFDLFEKSVNSFINCCQDLHKIDTWLCVDDNSSIDDRQKMKDKYPFFTFYFKTPEEKGHSRSMNIIRDNVKTEYIFHMEDDWQFFHKRDYISDCISVLGQSSNIGQCLINKNYSEVSKDIHLLGGIFNMTKNGIRYYIHEFTHDNEGRQKFNIKHGHGLTCNYWPHFSLRPSLLKKEIFNSIGPYNENINHFELDYSNRYVKNGFLSAFLDDTYSIHIGRLTSERNNKDKPNAYNLNNVDQFTHCVEHLVEPTNSIKYYVVNLEHRPDRLELFNKNLPRDLQSECTRFPAIDGNLLEKTVQLQQIFENNDYNMRCGIVGCALSHIKLYIELIKSDQDIFCIFEDDITFAPDFSNKLNTLLSCTTWDIIYLGHHERVGRNLRSGAANQPRPEGDLVLEKWTSEESLQKSIGGTFGYLITKNGAKKLLHYISLNGMTNAIDTVQQKAITVMDTYYSNPPLVYSNYVSSTNKLDSDISYNYKSLTIPYAERIELEKYFYNDYKEIHNKQNLLELYTSTQHRLPSVVFYTDLLSNDFVDEDVTQLCSTAQSYYIEKTLVIVNKPTELDLNNRYFNRLMKNNVYNIDDVFYKS